MSTFQARTLRRDELRSDTPLGRVFESFFISISVSPKTEEFYRVNLSKYQRYLAEMLAREPILEDVNADYANAFLKKLEKQPTTKYPKGSPFRARAASVTLKRLGNWLALEGNDGRALKASRNGDSVLKNIQKADTPKRVRRPLKDEEMDLILTEAGRPGARNYALIVFMAGTGIRLNEAREMRISDLNLNNRQATVRAETSKFKESRIVEYHDDVAREMDRYFRSRAVMRPDDPLFPTDEGRQFEYHGFAKVFQRIGKRAGVPRFSAHILRHTWASNFKRNGGDSFDLKRLGGWDEWEMVENYADAATLKDRTVLPNPTVLKVAMRPGTVTSMRRSDKFALTQLPVRASTG